METFKGKVYSYTNINGKVKEFEKEFNDFNEYNKYMEENGQEFKNFNRFFENPFENFFNMLRSPFGDNALLGSGEDDLEFSQYENEIRKIESEKLLKQKEIEIIDRKIEKLQHIIKKLKEHGKDDFVKKAEEDLKKLEAKKTELK